MAPAAICAPVAASPAAPPNATVAPTATPKIPPPTISHAKSQPLSPSL